MIRHSLFAAVLACVTVSADAAILVDRSPDTIGFVSVTTAGNQATSQNFLTRFTVGANTTLTGFDIYSSCNALGCNPITGVGTAVVVRFTADIAGVPDFAGLSSFATTLTAVDNFGSTASPTLQRFHADVTLPVTAGDYWFGISGADQEIGLDYRFGAGSLYLLSDTAGSIDFSGSLEMPYNVYAGAVPEPASWAMLIAGFGLVGAAMRRRTAALSA